MGKSLTLAVIGGDERQVFLASLALVMPCARLRLTGRT